MNLRKAVEEVNVAWVQSYLAGRLMVEVSPEVVWRWLVSALTYLELDYASMCRAYKVGELNKNDPCLWSSGSLDLFLRTRLAQEGYFVAGGQGTVRINFPVKLHTGFLGIWETEEQLDLLRRWKPDEDKDNEVPRLATPGIERAYPQKLEGIDAVARRVAPMGDR